MVTRDAAIAAEQLGLERAFLRLGGTCAMVGGLGYLAVGAAHGDLPSGSIETTLGYVAARPEWPVIHLAGIVCVLLWAIAIAGLASSLHTALAMVLGQLAVISVVIGAEVFIVDYSIDGYALKYTADAWAAAAPAEAEAQRQIGAALLAVLRGTVTASATWAFGLPFLLIGLAVAASRSYPRWLGWIAAVTGGASLFGGAAAYLRRDSSSRLHSVPGPSSGLP